jgi:hypothetical protein
MTKLHGIAAKRGTFYMDGALAGLRRDFGSKQRHILQGAAGEGLFGVAGTAKGPGRRQVGATYSGVAGAMDVLIACK